MGKPDNVRGLGSDYGLVMIKSTSLWAKKIKRDQGLLEREREERGANNRCSQWLAIKIAALQHFLEGSISIIENF